MEKDYLKLFQHLPPVHTPQGLSGAIFLRIDKEGRRAARLKLAFWTPLAFLSGVAVVFSFQYLIQDFAQSGTSQYLSVLFSDSGTVMTYWKEFALSLAEQVPVWGTVLFLGALLALLGSVKSLVKNIQTTLAFA